MGMPFCRAAGGSGASLRLQHQSCLRGNQRKDIFAMSLGINTGHMVRAVVIAVIVAFFALMLWAQGPEAFRRCVSLFPVATVSQSVRPWEPMQYAAELQHLLSAI